MAISKITLIPSKIWRKFALLYANLNYENKRQYLIKKGASIGKNTRMNCNVDSFGTEPYLIELGNNVKLSFNVTFLTHDGSTIVINKWDKYKGIVKLRLRLCLRIKNKHYMSGMQYRA